MENVNKIQKYDILTNDESETLVEYIIKMEDYVKSRGPDTYDKSSDNSLTGRHYCFNFLSIKVIRMILVPKIKNIFGSCIVQCWGNTLRKGESIGEHCHCDDKNVQKLSGHVAAVNIFLYGDVNIGTYYENVKHINKIGQLTVIPVDMMHHVPTNNSDDIRISIALDIYKPVDINTLNIMNDNTDRYFKI
tara:strand:+ start:79 stop:648 length:570 start_codon:yes stop_codon:yes gene_type:complete